MLDSVRQALDLPDAPRLPHLPDVPDDLPDACHSDFDGVVAAITELARHHDHVTPQLIERYLKEHGTDRPDARNE